MIRLLTFTPAALLAVLVVTAASAEPLPTEAALEERVLGDPDAALTIIEYASLTCPHCAHFHRDTLPELKANWIDTGRAKLIYRDYPTSPVAVSLAASMIARCAPKDRYFVFLGALYQTQENWASSGNPIDALAKVAQLGGMPRADVDKCLEDEGLLEGIRDRALDARMQYGIESTPSFVVNGQVVRGNLDYDDFADILEKAAK